MIHDLDMIGIGNTISGELGVDISFRRNPGESWYRRGVENWFCLPSMSVLSPISTIFNVMPTCPILKKPILGAAIEYLRPVNQVFEKYRERDDIYGLITFSKNNFVLASILTTPEVVFYKYSLQYLYNAYNHTHLNDWILLVIARGKSAITVENITRILQDVYNLWYSVEYIQMVVDKLEEEGKIIKLKEFGWEGITYNLFNYSSIKSKNQILQERKIYFQDLFRKVLEFVAELYSNYMESSKCVNRKDLELSVLFYIWKDLKNRKSSCEITPKQIIELINEYYGNLFMKKLDINHVKVLHNAGELYRRALIQMYINQQNSNLVAYERGIAIGSKVIGCMIKCGYEYDLNGGIVKKLDIRPKYCIYHNAYYEIPEKKRTYFVKDIRFDINNFSNEDNALMLKAGEADHPNISDEASICVGHAANDIYRKITQKNDWNEEEFQTLLLDVESSLEIINFDSAYRDMPQKLLKSLIPIQFVEGLRKPKKLNLAMRRV